LLSPLRGFCWTIDIVPWADAASRLTNDADHVVRARIPEPRKRPQQVAPSVSWGLAEHKNRKPRMRRQQSTHVFRLEQIFGFEFDFVAPITQMNSPQPAVAASRLVMGWRHRSMG